MRGLTTIPSRVRLLPVSSCAPQATPDKNWVNGHIGECHVFTATAKRWLAERPVVKGIALPGMGG